MSTGLQGNGRNGATISLDGASSSPVSAPTETLVASAVGDRCVNCGATLSSDQRYCVVCGERRGAPRFTLPPATVTTTEVTSTSRSRSPRGPRFGSGTTLVAGVGTLLLALLVGFLIGNAASKNNTKTVNAAVPPIRVVNVGGSGDASSTATTSGTSNSSPNASSGSHKGKTVHKTVVTKKVVSAESNAASKVLGGSNTPPPTTKVGQKCSGSQCDKAGYNKKTKKFDGSFFGQ